MKALFVYSKRAGKNKVLRYKNLIVKKLSKKYQVEDICYSSDKELTALIDKSNEYDTLVIAGGDGTFNRVISKIVHLEEKPILAYIPTGTLNDAGKSFGIRNIRGALKIIKRGNVQMVDVIKCNDRYFLYSAATGAFSDIPYEVKRKKKREFGHFAYYGAALKQVFKKHSYHFKVSGDVSFEVDAPFMLVLNGQYMGGFKIDKSNRYDDGNFDIFACPKGAFNGLLNYLIFKKKVQKYSASNVTIETDCPLAWCLDGEETSHHKIELSCLNKNICIFGK